MATTTITPTALTKDTQSADLPVTGLTAIVAANTHSIAYPKENKLLIVLNNTTAASKDFTIVAGDFQAAGVGDLTITMAQDDVRYLVVSSDRFKDSSGNVNITVAASTTGFIGAFTLP